MKSAILGALVATTTLSRPHDFLKREEGPHHPHERREERPHHKPHHGNRAERPEGRDFEAPRHPDEHRREHSREPERREHSGERRREHRDHPEGQDQERHPRRQEEEERPHHKRPHHERKQEENYFDEPEFPEEHPWERRAEPEHERRGEPEHERRPHHTKDHPRRHHEEQEEEEEVYRPDRRNLAETADLPDNCKAHKKHSHKWTCTDDEGNKFKVNTKHACEADADCTKKNAFCSDFGFCAHAGKGKKNKDNKN